MYTRKVGEQQATIKLESITDFLALIQWKQTPETYCGNDADEEFLRHHQWNMLTESALAIIFALVLKSLIQTNRVLLLSGFK